MLLSWVMDEGVLWHQNISLNLFTFSPFGVVYCWKCFLHSDVWTGSTFNLLFRNRAGPYSIFAKYYTYWRGSPAIVKEYFTFLSTTVFGEDRGEGWMARKRFNILSPCTKRDIKLNTTLFHSCIFTMFCRTNV